ncbi:MAG: DUF4906 domain-containing protein, partial [Alistipes sp.]|nr:DUF4906 domain-containing protein [Alistipes sp.]
MKVLRKLLLVGLVGAMFAACGKDPEFEDPMGPAGVGSGESVPTTLELSVSGMTSPVTVIGTSQTRAAVDEAVSVSFSEDSEAVTRAETTTATTAECSLKSLYILQFDDNNKFSKMEKPDVTTLSGTSLSVNVPLNAFDKSTVYAVANVPDTEFAGKDENFTLANFEALLYKITADIDIDNGLPMIGVWSGSTKDTSVNAPKIEMKRMVAKILFTCKQAVPSGHSFKLKSVQLCSVSPQTAFKAPDAGSTAPADPSKVTFLNYTVDKSAQLNQQYSWYVPENLRGEVTGITSTIDKGENNAPAGSTFIEVIGAYNNGVDPEADVTFRIFPGANSTTDFNVARNHKYAITATVKGNNPDDGRVVVATDLCKNPWDDSEATANCYMVSQAGHAYKFKATVSGNGAMTPQSKCGSQIAPQINPLTFTPASAKVLWETNGTGKIIKSVEYKNDWVYFTTAGDSGDAITEGNAVIAVYDASGNILWSWHIWSTAYDPTTDKHVYSTRAISASGYNNVPTRNETVMTRNLGAANNQGADAKSFGLLYQWGRKDPFVGSSATSGTTFVTTYPNTWPIVGATSTGSNADASIAYAIKHPTTFITQVNTTTYDWLNAGTIPSQRDNLWGNPNMSTQTPNPSRGSKSIYDPCPPGWRVGPQDTWTRFSTIGYNTSTASQFNVSGSFNIGWNFIYSGADKTGSKVYYPAAGYRYRETGALG